VQTIVVERTIPAPIEKVFDVLADHANYKSFPGVKDSRLLEAGTPDRNGVGAVRHIVTPGAWFKERITAYDRPRRFDYKIIEANLPIDHQGGSVRLESVAGGTRVTWTTTMRLKVPLIGGLLTRLATGKLQQAFGAMLKETERRLAA
jgi:uncharacterized protein YndB with AHSA1/START domain